MDALRDPGYIATAVVLNVYMLSTMAVYYRMSKTNPFISKRMPNVTLYGNLGSLLAVNVWIQFCGFFPELSATAPYILLIVSIYVFSSQWCITLGFRAMYVTISDYVDSRQDSIIRTSKSSPMRISDNFFKRWIVIPLYHHLPAGFATVLLMAPTKSPNGYYIFRRNTFTRRATVLAHLQYFILMTSILAVYYIIVDARSYLEV